MSPDRPRYVLLAISLCNFAAAAMLILVLVRGVSLAIAVWLAIGCITLAGFGVLFLRFFAMTRSRRQLG